jgi:hypothetical protein
MRSTLLPAIGPIAVLAACSGGGRGAVSTPGWASRAGVYQARVVATLLHPSSTMQPASPQRIWVDRTSGRFRIVTLTPRPRLSITADYDGVQGTERFSNQAARVIVFRGSPAFVALNLGGAPLRIVRAFLRGSPPPAGVRLRLVSAGPPARLVATTGLERLQISISRMPSSAATFAALRGRVAQTTTQLRPGGRPAASVHAYWLGGTWHGAAPRSSTETVGAGDSYTITYPHVGIEVDAGTGVGIGGTPVTLADGTRGTLQVARIGPDGSVSIDGGSALVAVQFASDGRPHGSLAFVSVPGAQIVLSGSAVTSRSAARIAAALRPL